MRMISNNNKSPIGYRYTLTPRAVGSTIVLLQGHGSCRRIKLIEQSTKVSSSKGANSCQELSANLAQNVRFERRGGAKVFAQAKRGD